MAAKPDEMWRTALTQAGPVLIEYLVVDAHFLHLLCADEIIDHIRRRDIKVCTFFVLMVLLI